MKRLIILIASALGALTLIEAVRQITQFGEKVDRERRACLSEMKDLIHGLSLNDMHESFEVANEAQDIIVLGYRFSSDSHAGFEYYLYVLLENSQRAALYQGCQVLLCTPDGKMVGVMEINPDSPHSLKGACAIPASSVELTFSLGVIDHQIVFDGTRQD